MKRYRIEFAGGVMLLVRPREAVAGADVPSAAKLGDRYGAILPKSVDDLERGLRLRLLPLFPPPVDAIIPGSTRWSAESFSMSKNRANEVVVCVRVRNKEATLWSTVT